MPSQNTIKQYVDEGIYHAYNRGVEKRNIFIDTQDYKQFLRIINDILVDPQYRIIKKGEIPRKNYFNCIELYSYCLMPNHFHLLLKQQNAQDMQAFMRSLLTSYSMYFNIKYKRVGRLFQGIYKAAMVSTDDQLIHTSRYIHLNPVELKMLFEYYPYSSYQCYANQTSSNFVNTSKILTYFSNSLEYVEFVKTFNIPSKDVIGYIAID
ncbi:transposase [Candidatus Saccharibacteria bacterium]|nr:transposase [Candidatus Saccharibacteria bacterium]